MGWVYRAVDQHKCNKPAWSVTIKEGDVWECDDCHTQYKVTKVRSWYDQRDNYAGGKVEYSTYSHPKDGYYRD